MVFSTFSNSQVRRALNLRWDLYCGGGGGSLVTKLSLTFLTPWTVAHHASLPIGFSMQGYWSGCHLLFQGIFPIQGLNLHLLHCRQILYRWATGKTFIAVWQSTPKVAGLEQQTFLSHSFCGSEIQEWHRWLVWPHVFQKVVVKTLAGTAVIWRFDCDWEIHPKPFLRLLTGGLKDLPWGSPSDVTYCHFCPICSLKVSHQIEPTLKVSGIRL